jgi:beta-lactamase regulating signal transducer with metallopeptidase domain
MMFQFLCDLAFKGTVLLLAATIVSLALRKSSAAARHRLWGLTMLSLLGLPVLFLLMPTIWSLTIPADVTDYVPSAVTPAAFVSTSPQSALPIVPAASSASPVDDTLIESSDVNVITPTVSVGPNTGPSRSWQIRRADLVDRLLLVWVSGVTLFLLNLAVGTRRVARFNAVATPVTDSATQRIADELRQRLRIARSVELREHPDQFVPLTVGIFRPVVILPRQARGWTDRLKRMVLLHELAHVYRRDVAYQWLGRLACAVYWFHPLAWWGLRRLRQEREQACDDLVIHTGERASEYAEELVSVAKHFQGHRGLPCAVAMARSGNLEGRMRSLFDTDVVRSHAPLGRVVAAVLLIAVGLVSGAVAAVQLTVEPKATPGSGDSIEETAASLSQANAASDDGILSSLADQFGLWLDSFDEHRAAGSLQELVKVLDEDGQPVAGASVIPWGFGTSNGTGWGWFPGWPKEFVTDAEGHATIFVSAQQTASIPAPSGDFTFISYRVEHPDYAPAVRSSAPLNYGTPVVLKRGLTVLPRAINAKTNQLITSDLYANSSGYPNPQWILDAGQLRSSAMNPEDPAAGRYFRVIHAPPDAAESQMLFSDVVDASQLAATDNRAIFDLPLYPAVSLTGTLSANVPLPLNGKGFVIAVIASGPEYPSCVWQDVTPISDEGTFFFPALPRNSHVELIAVCDGWVSKPSTETLAAYDKIHQTTFATLASHSMVSSTPVRLETAPVTVTLDMVQTGSCEFRIVDEKGNPLDLATVQCMPNHATRLGSTLLGAGSRSIDWLRTPDTDAQFLHQKGMERFTRVTNAEGVALISDLPAGSQMVQVDFPGYSVNPDRRFGSGFSMAVVDVKAGVKTNAVLKLRRNSQSAMSERLTAADADGFQQFMLRIVGADGFPLPDARIKLVGQSITSPGEQQPWPADWPLEIPWRDSGVAFGQVRLPANVQPEDAAKFSVWLDVEHPGHVPLKNHERSITSGLPIRMQAVEK